MQLLFRWFNKARTDEEQADPRQALVSFYSPKSAAGEAYRMLRTNIHFSTGGESLKVIQVTSTFPSEGKSLVAANLAITFAQAGDSVILVDTDMRRSSVHTKFEIPISPGLSEALVTGNVEASLRPGPVDGLRLIPAGTRPPNPSELLHSRRMDDVLEKLRGMADLIVLDTTPTLAVADANILAPKADGVVMVVNIGMSDKHANKHAVDTLRGVNARILGTVITGIKPAKAGNGYGKHRYDRYYYYYDTYYETDDPEHQNN